MACPASGGARPSHDHKQVKPHRRSSLSITSSNGSSSGSNGGREMTARPLEKEDPRSDEDGKGVHPRRWSPEEDERLRASVDRHHGTNWKDIAADVKSRNHVQCLQRWKKVLTPGLVKGQWSREEDELLTAVFNEGHKNWGALAARIPGRTSKQCRERWCHHLDPRIVKGKWTAEEDQTIVSMHQEMGNKWATIAQHLDGRTENATKIRWKILERSIRGGSDLHRLEKIARGNSCRQGTDARLRCLAAQAAASAMSKANEAINPIGIPENPTAVQSVLDQNFRDMEMARHMPFANGCNGTHVVPAMPTVSNTTTGNPNSASSPFACSASLAGGGPQEREVDCRESKKRKMPGGNLGALMGTGTGGAGDSGTELKQGRGGGEAQCGRRGWLPEEDERLRQAVGRLGEKNWRYVAQSVSTRTHIQCQQRWKKALRPGLVKGAWSLEEDENLVTLIAQGFTNWSELATHTPGRTAKQCRERWCHHLDPSVNHGNWTQEEDDLLCSLETRLGTKWAAIAREMPGRTEHAVKGRFKTLSREKRVGGAGAQISQRAKDMQDGRLNGKGRADTRMSLASASQQTPSPLPLMGVTVKSDSQEDDLIGSVRVMLGMAPSPLPMQPPTPCVASKKRRVATSSMVRHASARGCGEFAGKFVPHQQPQQQQRQQQQQQQQQQPQQQGEAVESAAQQSSELKLSLDHFNVATIHSETERMENNGLGEKMLQNGTPDAVSIARLLSVSSMGAESTTLSDVTSGCCGSSRTANTKNASLASSPVQASADEQQQQQQQQSVVGTGEEATSRLAQKRPGADQSSRTDVDTDLSYSTPVDKMFQPMTLPKDPYAAKMGDDPLSGNYSVSEVSSLVSKPSVVDYSDLASILIDGFDVCKDGVGSEGEFVTLGEDPYSDYSLTGNSIILQYPADDRAPTPPEHPPPPLEDQDAEFAKDYEEILGIPSDLTEALAAGVFDAENPCDPYF